MRVFAILLTILMAGLARADIPAGADAVPFRLYISDTFKAWSQLWPKERGRLADHCHSEDEMKQHHPGEEVWLGAANHCLGIGELDDFEEGTQLAACEYFIKAKRHYTNAQPKPEEAEALQRSTNEVTNLIANLGC